MLESCAKHPHELGVALCRRCGGSWCGTCLVYAFGPKKPPFCMGCAMVAGGVRSAADRPAMPRKHVKAQLRALKAEAKSAAKAAKRGDSDPAEDDLSGDQERAAEPEMATQMAETDWATPWWEDAQPTALAD